MGRRVRVSWWYEARRPLSLVFVATILPGTLVLAGGDGWKQVPDRTPILVIDGDGFAGAPVRSVDISHDGRYLAAASDAVVRVYDLQTSETVCTFRGYQEGNGSPVGYVSRVVFSPLGRYLVMGVSDNTLAGSTRVLDLENPGRLHHLVEGHIGCTTMVSFSPDGNYMVTSGCDGNEFLYRWHQDSGTATKLLNLSEEKPERTSALLPNHKDHVDDSSVPKETIVYRMLLPDPLSVGHVDADTEPISSQQRTAIPDTRFTSDSQFLISTRHQMVWDLARQGPVFDANELPRSIRQLGRSLDDRSFDDYQALHGLLAAVNVSPRPDSPLCVQPLITTGPEKTFHIGLWRYGNEEPSAVFDVSYYVTAIGWNTQARILAAADQLGRITVWRMDSEKKTSIRSGSKQLWNVVWDDTGTKLRFADRNYPNGRYHYNRYGGVTHEFDTRRLILREQRVDVEDRPIDLKTPFGVLGFRDAKFNWVRIDEQAVRRLIRGPAVDLNACEELPAEFGTVMSYLSSSYPGVSDEHLFLGTNRGHVVEIAIQRGVSRSVVHRPVRWFLGHTGAVTSLAMSPDRSLLATSSLDGTIRVWSLTPPRITGDLDAKMVGSTVAKFESGGRAYEAGLIPYQDRIIRFDDTTFFGRRRGLVQNKYRPGDRVPITAVNADGQPRTLEIVLQRSPDYAVPLWNLYLDSKGEWVAWTGQGYYAASSQGGKHIGWHINKDRHQVADFYTAEQFGRHLHQRQIVIDTMRLRSAEKATESAMESLTLLAKRPKAIESSSYEAFKAVLPPAISNLRVRQGDASGQPINVTFDVSHHRDRPLREAQLMINGRRVLASRSPVKSVEDPDHEGIMLASFNQSVLVENQIDSVSVRVTDRYGMHDFKNAQAFEWMPSVLESSARSDEELESVLYVLSIGVSQYRNPDMQLQFADRDAREFAKTWADRGRTVFSRVVTRTLMNSDATVDSIEESLDWLRKQSIQPQDLAIVFLAGHGIIDQDGDWYFACVDCDFKQLFRTAISHDRLEHQLGKVRSNLILFTDTCHAASLTAIHGGRGSRFADRYAERGTSLWRGTGMLTYAACLPEEESFESDHLQHGAFTTALLEFLRGGNDYNHDGWLEFSEMETYVNRRVSQLTQDRQHPDTHKPPGIGQCNLVRLGN